MKTLRQRDAADWAVLVPEDEADEDMVAMFDRRALLAVGDALAEAVRHPIAPHQRVDWTGPCPLCAALFAWKAATG